MSDNTMVQLDEEELRELIPEFQRMTIKYKEAERVQKILFDISETSSNATELSELLRKIHDIIDSVIVADNISICFFDEDCDTYEYLYYVDEYNALPSTIVRATDMQDSLIEHIIKYAQPIFLPIEEQKTFITQRKIAIIEPNLVDFLGIPLNRSGQVVGVLTIQSYHDTVRFKENDLTLLEYVSQHIMTAIERVKWRELMDRTIQKRTKQLKKINQDLEAEIEHRKTIENLQLALFEISEIAANQSTDINQFYDRIHKIIKKLLPSNNAVIALRNDDNALDTAYFAHPEPHKAQTDGLINGIIEYTIAEDQVLLISSAEALHLAERKIIDVLDAQTMMRESLSWLSAPLNIGNDQLGVIALPLYGSEHKYTNQHLEMLRFVSQHVAQALKRKQDADDLSLYASKLADEVTQRTAQLEQTNERLQQEIEKSKQAELKLMQDAFYDGLTGLANRNFFIQRLELAVAKKSRHPDNRFAVFFIDLDRFKLINDTLGHEAGDVLLVEIANRLKTCIRGHDTLARLGGDEFVILLDEYKHDNDIAIVSDRILSVLNSPFTYNGKAIQTGASLGIAPLIESYSHADDVLRDADVAMYQAKAMGRGQAVLFDASMREELEEAIELESEFRHAIENDDLECYLRPAHCLENDKLLFYQCKIQWSHPTLGDIKRDQFFQIAEQSKLTTAIDNVLVDFAITFLKHRKKQGETPLIALNLSTSNITQPALMEQLLDKIVSQGIDLKHIAFTFAERQWQYQPTLLLSSLKQLKRAGVTLILDDYGSGQAAINDLFTYPFDYIKLDRDYAQNLPRSLRHGKFIKAVNTITSELNIPVIADGIDTTEQLQAMTQLNVKFGMGDAVAALQKLYQ